MNWKNLLEDKCPKCSRPIFHSVTGAHSCINPDCDFKVFDQKYKQLIQNMKDNA